MVLAIQDTEKGTIRLAPYQSVDQNGYSAGFRKGGITLTVEDFLNLAETIKNGSSITSIKPPQAPAPVTIAQAPAPAAPAPAPATQEDLSVIIATQVAQALKSLGLAPQAPAPAPAQANSLQCPHCSFIGKTKAGLKSHITKTHKTSRV